MMKQRTWLPIVVTIVSGAIVFFVLDKVELPSDTMLWREIGNAGHIPLFGLLSLVLLWLSRALLGDRIHSVIIHYFISFVVTSGLGFATEFMQWFTPRDADFWDIVRDVIGALVFLTMYHVFERGVGRRRISPKKRLTLAAVALMLLLIGLSPVLAWSGAYLYRAGQAPLICGFESPWDRLFWSGHHAEIDMVLPPPGWSGQSSSTVARVRFVSATYPEFYYREPIPDWRGYSQFIFDIFSPADTAVHLSLRIEDVHHTDAFDDRFNVTMTIAPGFSTVKVDLAEIVEAPASRKMDMASIYAFSLFGHKPQMPFLLYLDNFRLE